MKKKDCERCEKSFTKMYRVRYIESVKNWVFMFVELYFQIYVNVIVDSKY